MWLFLVKDLIILATLDCSRCMEYCDHFRLLFGSTWTISTSVYHYLRDQNLSLDNCAAYSKIFFHALTRIMRGNSIYLLSVKIPVESYIPIRVQVIKLLP